MDEAYKLKNTSWSIFGTLDFEISDRLTFTAGANYTQDRKRFSTDVVGTDIFSAVDPSHPPARRSEEHTSELQSLMRISYAVFCLKKQNNQHTQREFNCGEKQLWTRKTNMI